MTTIIDYLSPQAKEIVKRLDTVDVGVISTFVSEKSFLDNKSDLTDLMIEANKNFCKYKIKEYTLSGELQKVSLLLIGGDANASRHLLPFLKKNAEKYNQPFFVFKSYKSEIYNEVYNPKISHIKYDYENTVIKLTKTLSFFNRIETEY